MPLTRDEKKLIKKIKKEYEKKGYSKERSETIANAVVYNRKIQLEQM